MGIHILPPSPVSARYRGLGAKQEAAGVLGDEIDDARLVSALALSFKEEAIDARLSSVFVVGESVEVEVEELLAVPISNGAWEEEAEEA